MVVPEVSLLILVAQLRVTLGQWVITIVVTELIHTFIKLSMYWSLHCFKIIQSISGLPLKLADLRSAETLVFLQHQEPAANK